MRIDERRARRIGNERDWFVFQNGIVRHARDGNSAPFGSTVAGIDQRIALKPFDQVLRCVDGFRYRHIAADVTRDRIEFVILIVFFQRRDFPFRETATDQFGTRLQVTFRHKRNALDVAFIPLRLIKHVPRIQRFRNKIFRRVRHADARRQCVVVVFQNLERQGGRRAHLRDDFRRGVFKVDSLDGFFFLDVAFIPAVTRKEPVFYRRP